LIADSPDAQQSIVLAVDFARAGLGSSPAYPEFKGHAAPAQARTTDRLWSAREAGGPEWRCLPFTGADRKAR